MKIEILQETYTLPQSFFIWLKTNLKCPECGKEGMVVKYRCNGKIGFFHSSSGIMLACENWNNCKSWWNKEYPEEFPWHTWLSSFHIPLDIDRGRHGLNFLNKLMTEHREIFNQLKTIDNKITIMCRNGGLGQLQNTPKEIKTDYSGNNSTLDNF